VDDETRGGPVPPMPVFPPGPFAPDKPPAPSPSPTPTPPPDPSPWPPIGSCFDFDRNAWELIWAAEQYDIVRQDERLSLYVGIHSRRVVGLWITNCPTPPKGIRTIS
jgi:hypothetical protein